MSHRSAAARTSIVATSSSVCDRHTKLGSDAPAWARPVYVSRRAHVRSWRSSALLAMRDRSRQLHRQADQHWATGSRGGMTFAVRAFAANSKRSASIGERDEDLVGHDVLRARAAQTEREPRVVDEDVALGDDHVERPIGALGLLVGDGTDQRQSP